MDELYTIDQLNIVAEKLWKKYQLYNVWAFYGPMGAGKTSLIHALAENLGMTDLVSSPTFSIINEYRLPDGQPVFHMDWYRLDNEEEAIQAGVEDSLLSGYHCWVEWPQRAETLLPGNSVYILLEIIDPQTRRITSRVAG